MKDRKAIPKKPDSEEKEPVKSSSSSVSQNGFFKDKEKGCMMVQNINIQVGEHDNRSDCMPGCFDFMKSIFRR